MKPLRITLFILFMMFTSAFLASCQQTETVNLEFDHLTQQIFAVQAGSSTLTKNYTLIYPEKFKVISPPVTLGIIKDSDFTEQKASAENLLLNLKTFSAETLSERQKTLWKTLIHSYEHDIAGAAFSSFYHILSPTSGIQAQLPILMCEYHIYDKNDLEEYLMLLKSMPDYFKSIVDWEKSKFSQGTFLTAKTCHDIIDQCRSFIEKPEENILIKTFERKVSSYTFLSTQEKKNYKAVNRTSVSKYVIPAYQSLIYELEACLPKAPADGGLSLRPQGKEYYEWLVQNETGTRHTLPEIKKYLNTMLLEAIQAQTSGNNHFSSYDSLMQTLSAGNPNSQLEHLKKSIQKDFPPISGTSSRISYVDTSLEEYLSPAFYLTPPIDDTAAQSIYVNRSKLSAGNPLFSTLAHEGYPGHLYQNAYLKDHRRSPLESVLSFGGYTEGWATYAELYAYRYAGLSDADQKQLRHSTLFSLALYSLCDIGVNYEGWTYQTCHHFLEEHGIADVEKTSSVYYDVIAEPASYLKYSIGYLEITQLKSHVKELLGKDYSDMQFHTFFLETGPTWFSVLWEKADKKLS